MASQQQLEEAKTAFHSRVNDVLQELEQSGVPKSSISDLKASLLADEASSSSCAEALLSAQSFSRCYPYMDTAKLMELLAESWEALCNRQDVETRDISRKITRLQQNPKAKKIDKDGTKMRQMEEHKAVILEDKTKIQLGLYRIRVLSSLHLQNQARVK